MNIEMKGKQNEINMERNERNTIPIAWNAWNFNRINSRRSKNIVEFMDIHGISNDIYYIK